jgi:Ca2+-binding RTX toxin-like protein
MLQLVLNHPPVANNQSVSTPEDTPKAIALTASDADGDALTYTVVAGPAHGTLSGTAPDFTYTPAVNYYGTDSFTFKANDGQLDSNVGTVTITVTPVNDAPSLTVSGPASAMRGQSATFTFDASDLTDTNPVGQRFSYSIDWGDGTPIQTVTGDYTIEVAHAFNHVRPSGTYTVAAVVTDEDGSGLPSAPAVTTIAISGAELQGTDLVVVGTSGSDSIQIRSVDTSGDLAVFMAGQIQGVFHPSGWINVYALAGDDVVQIQTAKIGKKTVSVTVPAAIFGAEGGDVLDALGSKANNILVGGDGDDTIAADGGRDLLFGGLGADSLRGGSGDDILVAGLSAYDADLVALRAIWDEWTRTDADYPTRVGHLRGTISGGRNGGYYLTAATASDDAAVDQLLGESGTDWFFYRSLGSLKDVIDRKRGEEVTLIDP